MRGRLLRFLGIGLPALLAAPAAAGADSALPSAELVTVTPRGFVATWNTTQPSDTTVCFGPAAGGDLTCETHERSTRLHRAEVEGLRPGRRYVYVLRSAGLPQPTSSTNPGTFTTLEPPPGRHLFDFALVSDVHIGEECAGTAEVIAGQSVPPCFSSPNYASRMARAMVRELNSRRIPLVLLNADNTAEGTYEQSVELRRILDRLHGRSRIARGSHENAGRNTPDPRCGSDNDCFRAVFFPKREPGRIFYSFDFRGHHFIALDSTGHDLKDPAQWKFLLDDLGTVRRSARKTFIFFHHPVSDYSSATTVPPLTVGVTPEGGQREFLEVMGRFPNVVGVLNSHTHRNFVAYSEPTGARLPYIENGANKEYPGGYGIFRVYEGGYMRTFHRLGCGFCRRWVSITRGEYFGLVPLYLLGTLSSRSFSHLYDCSVATPPPSLPGNESVVGGDTLRSRC